jgi:hypothetical protein
MHSLPVITQSVLLDLGHLNLGPPDGVSATSPRLLDTQRAVVPWSPDLQAQSNWQTKQISVHASLRTQS